MKKFIISIVDEKGISEEEITAIDGDDAIKIIMFLIDKKEKEKLKKAGIKF